ncbi:RNA polymerase alpha subunit C-terminal domain-containing protein [Mucilaginibacter gotjawali]|uniref:RecB family nuclease n=2 Tax=Mucilaginibacter gotjawali TaxID=1550579 RepID=A0A839SEU3_9SPHI|nr:RNA polymerase alpha subunit C-terminal domain-containing protein [Mucilaginibacter gotjawali]MBB3056078.1 putative RecB family nuclease [Mucilaginibacter gotjawali]BAU53585.1 hypothetical protein MgSA37_01754 [Mucilaginibacter gotjawali]
MATGDKNLRVCNAGHRYKKSSDCQVCPVCEQERKPENGFLSTISAPARRALEREGIITLKQLSMFSKKNLLKLHGFGPGSIPKLENALKVEGLNFKIDEN